MLDGIAEITIDNAWYIEDIRRNGTAILYFQAQDAEQYLTCDCKDAHYDFDGVAMYCSKCGSVPVVSGHTPLTPGYNIGDTLKLVWRRDGEEISCIVRVLAISLRRFGSSVLRWGYELRHLEYLEE